MKHTPANPVSRDDLLAAVLRKRSALIERDSVLLTEQLALEAAGVIPRPPSTAADPRRAALALVNGFADPGLPPAGSSREERLYAVRLDREATSIAIDMLIQSEIQARAVATALVMQDTGDDWRQIQRRRCLAIVELRRANAAASRFRNGVVAIAGWPPGLIADRINGQLFGPPVVSDAAYTFLQDCVAAGIVTAKEISDDE